jgi:hypothetical protein
MKRARRSLDLKCLTVAVAVALLAAPSVQAAATNDVREPARTGSRTELHSVTAPQHPGPSNGSAKSYFWTEASITAAVLAGIVVLGLWGDVAIGGVIFGVQLLCAGAALPARKVVARAREGSRRVGQVGGSSPVAPPRDDPAPALPPPGVAP